MTALRSGCWLFVAGHASTRRGLLGGDVTLDDASRAAREVALKTLDTIATELGSLERVSRVVKVLGFVNATRDFGNCAPALDGASSVFLDAFGLRGRHARSAVGLGSLPQAPVVELEVLVATEFV